MNKKSLFVSAAKVRKNAHAPYSNFRVGAALLDNEGRVFTGCNFENSSYGATICAERGAIAAMVAGGGRSFSEIVIVTDTENGCPPCGICRQVLAEFAADPSKAQIHVANTRKIMKSFSLFEMLPETFDSSFLAKKQKRTRK